MSLSGLQITWLGHGTMLFKAPDGRQILVDPWLSGNPACPEEWKQNWREKLNRLELVLVSHGHFDHVEDAVSVAGATGATVVSNFEICKWLEQKGVQKTSPMNKGGTQLFDGVSVTMTDALHSSSYIEDGRIVYLGEPAGFVLGFENAPTVYFAGDTALFGDMRLIRELHAPELACLPVGDLYTMDPRAAGKACEMLGIKQVLPMHHGTFPALTGTPAMLREFVQSMGINVIELKPGETAS
jgi:L-ascorbate metabolism protein UlaG (beta-lactamase superfamily)